MTLRADREDLTRQREKVAETREAYAKAADDVAGEAHVLAKALRRRTGEPESDDVGGAYRAMLAAEEAYDLARLDLHTAAGWDA